MPSKNPPAESVPALPNDDSRHPPGLYVLFGTEAWERFSYYGMRALLVLYLVKQLGYSRPHALAVFATYTGLVYVTPVIGGLLADRLLGRRKAVLIGGLVMACGHLAMARESLLTVALGLLVVGNGFFKPNISSIVGGLYRPGDPRRDGGFTVFYMGINLGAFFSPLVCGALGERIGWHWGFSVAGLGMAIGLLIFAWGQRWLGSEAPSAKEGSTGGSLGWPLWRGALLWTAAIVAGVAAFASVVLPRWQDATIRSRGLVLVLVLVLAVAVALIAWGGAHVRSPANHSPSVASNVPSAPERLTLGEWKRIAVIVVLALFVIVFWMGFEQAGGTMSLFAEEKTERHFLGVHVPASYFQSINPLMVISLAPLFSRLWTRLDASRYRLSTPAKMGIGMMVLGLGFVVMYLGDRLSATQGRVSPLWLVMVYFFHTAGELCLSPIGLSMVTKLAPQRMVSVLMGLWLLSSALANYLAGRMEELLHVVGWPIYGFLMCASIGTGLVVLALSPLLSRWMQGRG